MYRSILLGCPALVLATSCVPPAAHQRPPLARATTDSHTLLRQLALHVPQGLRELPLAPAETTTPARLEAAPPFSLGLPVASDRERATDCLTAAVYYEARSESTDGQRAVAQVVLNRVRDPAFPASVCGVVYQGAERRTGCQFSFTCDGSMDRVREPEAWDRARTIATAALSGFVYAPVGSATYYHANSVLPWWAASLTRIGAIGAHIFYRWRDRMEDALAFHQAYAGTEPDAIPTAGGGTALTSSTTRMGVTVHYGGRDDAAEVQSVTIHRGTADATTTPVQVTKAQGVRIHRGALETGTTPDGFVTMANPVDARSAG